MRELLVGEIEGARARLARGRALDNHQFEIEDEIRFERGDPRAFDARVEEFLARDGERMREAAFAVGGPVEEGRVARLTKESFVVSRNHLERRHNLARVTLMNDFVALARGAVEAPASAFVDVLSGGGREQAAVVVVGPGVGLGMATIRRIDDRWMAFESEGGHQSFAPSDPKELALWKELFIARRHVTFEHVISEAGVVETYRLLSRMADMTPSLQSFDAVVKAALSGASPEAVEACVIVANTLGTFAGDACLAAGARGGVILAGSVARSLEPFIKSDAFEARFKRRDAMTLYMSDVPVRILRDDSAVLLGLTAHCASLPVP